MARWLRRLLPALSASIFLLTIPGHGTPHNLLPRHAPNVTYEAAQAAIFRTDPIACREGVRLSEDAAALVGALALVEARERPAQAGRAAAEIDRLLPQAGGTDLFPVLAGLAGSLEAYAQGDVGALAGIEAASARNARLRAEFRACSDHLPESSQLSGRQ